MPTEREMLEAVLASPLDDAPRLIYADWLDERGNVGDAERAELIRVQHALAHAPSDKLREAEKRLLGRTPNMPFDLLPKCLFTRLPGKLRLTYVNPAYISVGYGDTERGPAKQYHLRSGFVHKVMCTFDDWLECGDRIVHEEPVEEVLIALSSVYGRVHRMSELRKRWPRIKFKLS